MALLGNTGQLVLHAGVRGAERRRLQKIVPGDNSSQRQIARFSMYCENSIMLGSDFSRNMDSVTHERRFKE